MRALLNDKKIKNIIMAILIGVCILIISWPSDKSTGTSGNSGANGNSGSSYNNTGNSS